MFIQCDAADEYWAFTWDGASPPVAFPLPPGAISMTADGIGPTGVIASNVDFEGDGFGYLAHIIEGGVIQALPIPAGADGAVASATNGSWVVGSRGNNGDGILEQAVVWDLRTRAVSDIPVPIGPRSLAMDVNGAGHICGWMGSSDLFNSHAFLDSGETITDLGPIPGGVSAIPQAINASDTIVGQGIKVDPRTRMFLSRGFIWSQGRMTVVEPLAGYQFSSLRDINDHGDIVGRFWSPSTAAPRDGFLLKNGRITLLSEFVPAGMNLVIEFPKAITNDGRILASGTMNFHSVAVLLTPIPPSPDLDNDGVVGGSDLAILLGAWGACEGCAADLDENGTVDAADLAILLGAWNG